MSRRARTRAEQKESTRARLLVVARQLFTEHGYEDTSIAIVCRRARVTHGALYHHFPGKLELFEAVLEDVTREIVVEIHERLGGVSGWARLETAADVYLEKCADPTVIAVLLRDGPRVVSQSRFDQIDHDANEPLVTGLLAEAVSEGVLCPMPVQLFARMLGAAFAEAGSAIAESPNKDETRRTVRALLLTWLEAFRAA
jgi:AcrR family transcriptional regulator